MHNAWKGKVNGILVHFHKTEKHRPPFYIFKVNFRSNTLNQGGNLFFFSHSNTEYIQTFHVYMHLCLYNTRTQESVTVFPASKEN